MSENIKLRACLKDIEKILEHYKIGGFVAIADDEGGEFKFFNPEWSVLKTRENDGLIDV